LVLVAVNSVRVISDWSRTFTPAITWHGVDVLTPQVSPGGELRIVYRMTVNKSCPADVRGFMVAPDGSVPIRFPLTTGGYTKPTGGPVDALVNIIVPMKSSSTFLPIVPGRYIYRAIVTRYCPEGVEDDLMVPEAPFEMVIP